MVELTPEQMEDLTTRPCGQLNRIRRTRRY